MRITCQLVASVNATKCEKFHLIEKIKSQFASSSIENCIDLVLDGPSPIFSGPDIFFLLTYDDIRLDFGPALVFGSRVWFVLCIERELCMWHI